VASHLVERVKLG